MKPEQTATTMLTALNRGNRAVADELLPVIYEELRQLASRSLQSERPNHTLQPTALAHEAYLRLIDQSNTDWQNKAHFMAMAAEMIRRILVDHARKHNAIKRGGGKEAISIGPEHSVTNEAGVDLLALDESLTELGERSERQRRVVEMRFFAGLSVEDTAHVLGVSPATVKDDWRLARAWLHQKLKNQE
jgi:RNA polymerase sigma factor (TIGR02999 family)